MRSAILGAYFASSPKKASEYVAASTRLTHTDPRALTGAMAVATLAGWSVLRQPTPPPDLQEIISILRGIGEDEDREWQDILLKMRSAYGEGSSVIEFARGLGSHKGISGYVYHTVPVAIYAWLRHYGDFQRTLESVLDCGGDTDTVGAITGALAGAAVGEKGIPAEWIIGIKDWPRGPSMLMKLGDRLAQQCMNNAPLGPVRYFWPGVIPRNVLFLAIVLVHGFRRLAPPY